MFRRVIAALCTIGFLLFSFVHAVDFVDSLPTNISYQTGDSDGAGSPPIKSTGATNHCHVCAMLTLEILPSIVFPDFGERVVGTSPSLSPHVPGSDPPYPIVLI